MAESESDEDKTTNGTSTTITPTVRPDDPPPSAASPAPTGRATTSATSTSGRNAAAAPEGAMGGVVAQVGEVATASLRVTRGLLPGRAPAYLGAGALLVAGIIDLPALLAGGLAYEALRRWKPAPG